MEHIIPNHPKKTEEEKPVLPEGHRDGVSKGQGKKEEKPAPVDNLVESNHALTIDGGSLSTPPSPGRWC